MKRSNYYREFIQIATTPTIYQRSLKVALLVGTVLMMINHGDAILSLSLDGERVSKILITYLVPFCVSTQASVSATFAARQNVQH